MDSSLFASRKCFWRKDRLRTYIRPLEVGAIARAMMGYPRVCS